MIGNIQKFSFAEMTSNDNGKTSGSGTLGLFIGFAGVIGFLFGILDYSFWSKDGLIMSQSIIVISIGAGLLGWRKAKEKTKENTENKETVKEIKEEN